MRNNYKTYIVRYHNHSNNGGYHINDCFGNSLAWTGRARTAREAVSKAFKETTGDFRLYSVTEVNNP